MAAIVQTYPQQAGSVTMLQTRSTSNSGMMPHSQPQPNHQYVGTTAQAPRSAYPGSSPSVGYRGSSVPMQQYSYTSTPNLNQPWQHPYGGYRTNSSPAAPTMQTYDPAMTYRGRTQASSPSSMYGPYTTATSQTGSRDDSALLSGRRTPSHPRPHSVYLTGTSQPNAGSGAQSKMAPDRYRRPNVQPIQHARSQSMTLPPSAASGHASQPNNGPNNSNAISERLRSFHGAAAPGSSVDDLHINNKTFEEGKRMRRRSMHTVSLSESDIMVTWDQDMAEYSLADTLSFGQTVNRNLKSAAPASGPPMHQRNGSSESASSRSSHSQPSSATNRNSLVPTSNPSLLASSENQVGKSDKGTPLTVPSRGPSSDATKRTLSPSPLSKPATMANTESDGRSSAAPASSPNLDTPAAKQLAALNKKGGKGKGKTSKLRRAFSFGSATEFRRVGVQEEPFPDKSEPAKLHKDPTPEEAYDAEQARIAQAQEAAGIGNNIYGSRFFGSTDNLSISSTASSASVMLRKMGRGVKKGTRSLAGLFRPKSVIGVPAAEPLTPETSQAIVSMITVEAETQRVNVTAKPQVSNGGTGFPHLERNSMDAGQVPDMIHERVDSSSETDCSNSRRSIIGGDKERAEVLAAVRKGILKRSLSPSKRTTDGSPELDLPTVVGTTDSPNSSVPSTPKDEAHGHKRTGSIAMGSDDYFMSALRFRQDNKSAPGTPQGSKRNATFSPRIVFYDTWPSQEYDRRGEIATCNRLTPMLAQQIKEELNTFKMEMEVHENSKIYTHFF